MSRVASNSLGGTAMIGNRPKGFSIIEVMIALSILSVGLLGLATLFGISHRVLHIGNQETLAARLAQNKMEALRAVRPQPITERESIQGMTREWSITKSETDPRLWVITVLVFPAQEPDRSVLLKSLLYY